MLRRKSNPETTGKRRQYPDDFKENAVRMLLDGHSAQGVADRLGLSGTQIQYRWKKQMMAKIGPVADSLDTQVQELERELRRVERERDIQKNISHFQPSRAADVYPAVERIVSERIVSERIGSKAQVCKVLAVSRSAFHVWQKRIPTQHELEDALIMSNDQSNLS